MQIITHSADLQGGTVGSRATGAKTRGCFWWWLLVSEAMVAWCGCLPSLQSGSRQKSEGGKNSLAIRCLGKERGREAVSINRERMVVYVSCLKAVETPSPGLSTSASRTRWPSQGQGLHRGGVSKAMPRKLALEHCPPSSLTPRGAESRQHPPPSLVLLPQGAY